MHVNVLKDNKGNSFMALKRHFNAAPRKGLLNYTFGKVSYIFILFCRFVENTFFHKTV